MVPREPPSRRPEVTADGAPPAVNPPAPAPPAPPRVAHGARAIGRHALLNLAGQAIPILAAVLTVPVLLRGLGTERFGILTLAWVVLGYFSLFDMGLGRALTQAVAERRAAGGGREGELRPLVARSVRLLFFLGAAGGVVALAIAHPLASRWLAVTPALQPEATRAFALLALGLPLVTVTSGLRGALEGYQRFDVVNAIRIPLGISNYVVPALMLPWKPSLAAIVLVLMTARALALAAHLAGWRRVAPAVGRDAHGDAMAAPPLRSIVGTGGWMTVSNVVSPIMSSLDRFLVGALASTAVVAYYATPNEMLTKLWIVPSAVAGALFPVLASLATAESGAGRARVAGILVRGVEGIAAVVFPAAVVALLFADEGLTLWLGAEFARHAAPALRILAVGVYVNCMAQLLFAAVQAAGRARWTAVLHVAELPLYLGLAVVLIRWRPVEGAALAWTIRVSVDALLLLAMTRAVSPGIFARGEGGRWVAIAASVAIVVALPAAAGLPMATKAVMVLLACAASVVVMLRAGVARVYLPAAAEGA